MSDRLPQYWTLNEGTSFGVYDAQPVLSQPVGNPADFVSLFSTPFQELRRHGHTWVVCLSSDGDGYPLSDYDVEALVDAKVPLRGASKGVIAHRAPVPVFGTAIQCTGDKVRCTLVATPSDTAFNDGGTFRVAAFVRPGTIAPWTRTWSGSVAAAQDVRVIIPFGAQRVRTQVGPASALVDVPTQTWSYPEGSPIVAGPDAPAGLSPIPAKWVGQVGIAAVPAGESWAITMEGSS